MSKYTVDGPFNDPVVRCCECQSLIHRGTISKQGCCPGCGSKRVKSAINFSEKEMETLKKSGIDPEFLKLFEPNEDAEGVIDV
jgi:hypothetical protein